MTPNADGSITTKELRDMVKIPEELAHLVGERADFDIYWMGMCYYISVRSTCLDRQLGAVLVKDKALIGIGYNGAPKGVRDCIERGVGCMREAARTDKNDKMYHNCLATHAEANAIVSVAFNGGAPTKDSIMYTIAFPCVDCTRLLINAGIKKIVYTEKLPNSAFSDQLLAEAGVETEMIPKDRVAAALYKSLEHLIKRDENGKIKGNELVYGKPKNKEEK